MYIKTTEVHIKISKILMKIYENRIMIHIERPKKINHLQAAACGE